MTVRVVIPWVRHAERDAFVEAWNLKVVPPWVLFQHDALREGCGATKNAGVRRAVDQGADVVIVLDGDCYPAPETSLLQFVDAHLRALEPQQVQMFEAVTKPPSRGTPYGDLTAAMPVAASLGFWHNVPDFCAVRQLAHAGSTMTFDTRPIFGRYFPLCGMNVAFKPREWWPWCQFIEVSRFDDIWMGWLWQKEAYRRGYCFNMNGPFVTHARQSNVWRNLIDEAVHLEATETLWRRIMMDPATEYSELLALLPTGTGRLDDR